MRIYYTMPSSSTSIVMSTTHFYFSVHHYFQVSILTRTVYLHGLQDYKQNAKGTRKLPIPKILVMLYFH